MPLVQFVPSSTSWFFDPVATPTGVINLPVGNNGGNIYLDASTSGSPPVDGEGVIFSVEFDGIPSYTSACMENGSDTVPVPPGTLTISVTSVSGCNGGFETTQATVSGAG